MSGFKHDTRTTSTTDEWLTPPNIIQALGTFDLDPCAPIERPWNMAIKHYTVKDNGLLLPWHGRVWCNPPYRHAKDWLEKLAGHGRGIALVYARTETKMFFDYVWKKADALLFLKGRLKFYYTDGQQSVNSAQAGSVLIAYGLDNVVSLKKSGLNGFFIDLHLIHPLRIS